MQVQRLNFRELSDGQPVSVTVATRKFLSNGKSADAPPPPPAVYKEEDIKAAEREGYKKGFLEGEQEGRKQAESEQASIERKLAVAIESFATAVTPLFIDYRQMMTEIKQHVPQVALAIGGKVAGQSLAANAQAVVEDMAMRFCELMIQEPKLTVTVHESLGESLEKKLKDLTTRLQAVADIIVVRDPNLPISDCRVEWKHGIMERDGEKLWQQIEQAVEKMTATAKRDTEEHMDKLQAQMPQANEQPSKKE